MAGFIDGDLVEKFLDLPRKQMEEIVRDIKVERVNRNIPISYIYNYF